MFVGSGRAICWGRRSWSNVCSGPIFGVDTVGKGRGTTPFLSLAACSRSFFTLSDLTAPTADSMSFTPSLSNCSHSNLHICSTHACSQPRTRPHSTVLPAISSLSLRETQKIVLNIRNFSIYAGTTGRYSYYSTVLQRSWACMYSVNPKGSRRGKPTRLQSVKDLETSTCVCIRS